MGTNIAMLAFTVRLVTTVNVRKVPQLIIKRLASCIQTKETPKLDIYHVIYYHAKCIILILYNLLRNLSIG